MAFMRLLARDCLVMQAERARAAACLRLNKRGEDRAGDPHQLAAALVLLSPCSCLVCTSAAQPTLA